MDQTPSWPISRHHSLAVAVFALACTCASSPDAAFAGDGYENNVEASYVHWPSSDFSSGAVNGGSLSISGRDSRWLNWVVHASFGAGRQPSLVVLADDPYTLVRTVADEREASLLAGLRIQSRRGVVRPYAEIQAGLLWAAGRTRAFSMDWASKTRFALGPAVGVDLMASRRVAVRLGIDFPTARHSFGGSDVGSGAELQTARQLHAGLVFYFRQTPVSPAATGTGLAPRSAYQRR
jgi:hypothetical protein